MAWAEAEALFGLAQTGAEDFKPDQELPESCRKASEAAEEALRLAREVDDELLIMHAMQVVAKTRIMCFRHWEAGPFVEEALEIAQKNSQRMEEASLWLLKAQICICDGEDDKAKENAIKSRDIFEEVGNEQGMEQAREIVDGDYLRQQQEEDERGVTAATPMAMMPSESQMYGSGGIGGRSGGPGAGQPMAMAPAPAAPSAAPAAPPPKGGPSLQQIQESVQDIAMSLIGSDELAMDDALMDAGLDSLASVEFQNTLVKEFRGVPMPSTMMFDFPTSKEILGDNFQREDDHSNCLPMLEVLSALTGESIAVFQDLGFAEGSVKALKQRLAQKIGSFKTSAHWTTSLNHPKEVTLNHLAWEFSVVFQILSFSPETWDDFNQRISSTAPRIAQHIKDNFRG
eukprot:symbB.v1.2.035491.t1/scaffold4770.1/size35053/3